MTEDWQFYGSTLYTVLTQIIAKVMDYFVLGVALSILIAIVCVVLNYLFSFSYFLKSHLFSFLNNIFSLFAFFAFFGLDLQLVGCQLPDQGLNLGLGSESTES